MNKCTLQQTSEYYSPHIEYTATHVHCKRHCIQCVNMQAHLNMVNVHGDLIVSSSQNHGPVVQSIVSLTISLRHKIVKQISAKVTNTLLFFVEKM